MNKRSSFRPEEQKQWKLLLTEVSELLKDVNYEIKRTKLKDFAVTYYDGKKYFIRINRDLPYNQAFYALVEEIAHIKRGISGDYYKDHDDTWGKIYSRTLRQLKKWLTG